MWFLELKSGPRAEFRRISLSHEGKSPISCFLEQFYDQKSQIPCTFFYRVIGRMRGPRAEFRRISLSHEGKSPFPAFWSNSTTKKVKFRAHFSTVLLGE